MNKNLKLKKIKISESLVAHLRFKKIKEDYLITNDFGYFHFLGEGQFINLLEGSLNKENPLYNSLYKEGFIKRDLSNMDNLIKRFSCRKSSLKKGPSLHIVITTLRCNYNCIYCQANSINETDKKHDMTRKTAKKVVDRIFETNNKKITILFQGGEPMLNWKIVKFITNYVREKEKNSDKKINLAIVTNLSLMNKERLKFFVEKKIGICTSLDGPEKLHNNNRPYKDGNSYREIVKWLEIYNKKKKINKKLPPLNGLMTTTKYSLNQPREIVDEYFKLGFSAIHLRKLNYGGKAKPLRKKIGYSVDEFINFWEKGVERVFEINKDNLFYERGLLLRLQKIFKRTDIGYLDLSSPCGAVLGQVVYNYDGNIYTCDEGRMVNDDTFKLGHIDNISYEEMIRSDLCQTMLSASTLENQACDLCPYKPYCGVCPVQNYSYYGTLFPNIKETEWCKINTAIFDYIFKKIRKNKDTEVFEKWLPGLKIT